MIRPAQPADVAAMQRLSAAAGRRFAEIDDPRVAACAGDPPPTAESLAAWIAGGRAWVAVDGGDDGNDGGHDGGNDGGNDGGGIVGFVVVDVLDGSAHVEEISVLPGAGCRGLGTALLDAVGAYAKRAGHAAVTLTTFADVPWNRPWYERRGFVAMAPREIGPELAARVQEEADHGLDPAVRVCMRRPT
jgi:ribosomal protein S18 acetylase RimI-like enzyme